MTTSAFSRAAAEAGERTVHVIQGQHAIVAEPNVVLSTILGSCVAACLHDPVARIGGMNHFLLPGDEGNRAGEAMKYGVNAMELLINGLLQRGATRARLQAKLFGGAHVVQNLSDIGATNGAFALKFLEVEGIVCVSQSLGGDRARRIRYWPESGRASQILLEKTNREAFAAERRTPAPQKPPADDVELF
jgi:chemotaxis protein CheD